MPPRRRLPPSPRTQPRLAFGQRPRSVNRCSTTKKRPGKENPSVRLIQATLNFSPEESAICHCEPAHLAQPDEPAHLAQPDQPPPPPSADWTADCGLSPAAWRDTASPEPSWDIGNCMLETLLRAATDHPGIRAVSAFGMDGFTPVTVRKFLYNLLMADQNTIANIMIGDISWEAYVIGEMGMCVKDYAEHLALGGFLGVPDAAIINFFFPDIGITILDDAGYELASFAPGWGNFMLYLQFDGRNDYKPADATFVMWHMAMNHV